MKRPQRVFARHLLAPVHDKVCVVQRTGFDVAGFSSGLDMFFVKRLVDQDLLGFFDLDGGGGDCAENDSCCFYGCDPVATAPGSDPGSDTQHREIKSSTAP